MTSSASGSGLAGAPKDEYVSLDKLEEGVVSAIKVMVCRKWDSMNSYGKYLSTEYILSDCEGHSIQCSARSNIAHRFLCKLHEGSVYVLKNFSLIGNKEKFRVRKNDPYIISLEGYTVVKPLSCSTDGFVRFPYELINFDDVEFTDSAYLIDVVGFVADAGKVRTIPSGSELMDFTLVNASGTRMRVTLWAPLCNDFIKRRAAAVTDYVVVLTEMNVKDFTGEPYLSNTSATTLFDSPDVPQISSLLELLSIDSNNSAKKVQGPIFVNGSIYQLLRVGREQKGSRKKGRIVGIRTKDGWFYFSCGNGGCKKRVSTTGASFTCRTCNKVCEFPCTIYRLHVNVVDSTGAVVLTMFDDMAVQLVGKSAAQLLEDIGDDGDESVLPAALLSLTDTHHTFEVKTHTYYDQGAFESFSVNNLICTSAEKTLTAKRAYNTSEGESQCSKRNCVRGGGGGSDSSDAAQSNDANLQLPPGDSAEVDQLKDNEYESGLGI